MQYNLEHNKWWDSKKKEKKDSKKNEGRCLAIGKFRDVLGIYQYHQDKHVASIMKTQVERIGKAFKTMDEEILPNQLIKYGAIFNKKNRPRYVSIGLADKWNKFMKAEFDNRISRIEEWMEVWAKVFKDIKDGNGVKDLGTMFNKRAKGQTEKCTIAEDDELIGRIKLLLEAYKKRDK